MKKILLITLIVSGGHTVVNAQFSVGVKAGAGITHTFISKAVFVTDNMGLTETYDFPDQPDHNIMSANVSAGYTFTL